jgi:thiosulfate dehydrogenase [quinone] large subunit
MLPESFLICRKADLASRHAQPRVVRLHDMDGVSAFPRAFKQPTGFEEGLPERTREPRLYPTSEPHGTNMQATTRETSLAKSWQVLWAGVRIVLGFTLLWAFLDKTFGLNYTTKPASSWLNGGSPTNGFLSHTTGWFAGGFQAIAGNVVVDWLFMAALLLIGLALVLGVGIRIAGIAGAALMILMYAAATLGVAGTTNPIVDDHIVYALLFVGMAIHPEVGDTLGLGRFYHRIGVVRSHASLQ